MDRNTPLSADSPGAAAPPKRTERIWAISEYYAPNFSGAAIQAHQILSGLVTQGFEVEVLTQADQVARNLQGQRVPQDGLVVHYLPVVRQRRWTQLQRWPALRSWLRQFNRLLRDASFHTAILMAVVFRMRRGDRIQWYIVGDFAWPVFWLARQMGRRNFIQVSLVGADDPHSFKRSLFGISTAFKRACFWQAEKTIVLSRALLDRCLMAQIPQERLVRIPNGVDTRRFAPTPELRRQTLVELNLAPSRRYLVFLGSAIERKGIDVAIRAFVPLARQFADIDLRIV